MSYPKSKFVISGGILIPSESISLTFLLLRYLFNAACTL